MPELNADCAVGHTISSFTGKMELHMAICTSEIVVLFWYGDVPCYVPPVLRPAG